MVESKKAMKEIIDKISSYNLFNYLFPGVLFAVLLEEHTHYTVLPEEIVLALFVCYFLGLVISRIGSLVIEPTLKLLNIIQFAPYEDFILASKSEPKLSLLSEANNMYRTLCALFVSLGIAILFEWLTSSYKFIHNAAPFLLFITLTGLFVLSYRKQTMFITKRVKATTKE